MMRKAREGTGEPVLFVIVRRIESVPIGECWLGSDVKSRTRFGGCDAATAGPSSAPGTDALALMGLVRPCGPGAPSFAPSGVAAPAGLTTAKSAALSEVAFGRPAPHPV